MYLQGREICAYLMSHEVIKHEFRDSDALNHTKSNLKKIIIQSDRQELDLPKTERITCGVIKARQPTN